MSTGYEAPIIKLDGADELQKQLLRLAEQEAPRRLRKFLLRHGLKIAGDAQRALSRGGRGRYTGRLATSYTAEVAVSPGRVEMRAGTNVTYARWVEGYPDPPRRHFVPYSIIGDWARRIAHVPASVVSKGGGMMVGGPKSVRPHFMPSIKKNWPVLVNDVDQALDT